MVDILSSNVGFDSRQSLIRSSADQDQQRSNRNVEKKEQEEELKSRKNDTVFSRDVLNTQTQNQQQARNQQYVNNQAAGSEELEDLTQRNIQELINNAQNVSNAAVENRVELFNNETAREEISQEQNTLQFTSPGLLIQERIEGLREQAFQDQSERDLRNNQFLQDFALLSERTEQARLNNSQEIERVENENSEETELNAVVNRQQEEDQIEVIARDNVRENIEERNVVLDQRVDNAFVRENALSQREAALARNNNQQSQRLEDINTQSQQTNVTRQEQRQDNLQQANVARANQLSEEINDTQLQRLTDQFSSIEGDQLSVLGSQGQQSFTSASFAARAELFAQQASNAASDQRLSSLARRALSDQQRRDVENREATPNALILNQQVVDDADRQGSTFRLEARIEQDQSLQSSVTNTLSPDQSSSRVLGRLISAQT